MQKYNYLSLIHYNINMVFIDYIPKIPNNFKQDL